VSASIPEERIALAFRHCEQVTRQRARNFYYGLRLSPEPHRSALFAVYAWMRLADDLIDDSQLDHDSLRQSVNAFMESTEAAFEDEVSRDSNELMWIALSATAKKFPIRLEHFREMMQGQLDDVAGTTYATFDQLEQYCYRVASTVGLICIDIWGYRDSAARDLAVQRGIAFQLTNILRDIREDHARGRVYLPSELFRRHDVTIEHLLAWTPADRCRQLVLEVVDRAERRYAASEPLDSMITASCLPTLWAMTRIYHSLLDRMRERPERVVMEKRLRLSALRKGAIALKARLMAGTVSHR